MVFDGSGLVREAVFGGSSLIRGAVFGGSGLVRGGLRWEWPCKRRTTVYKCMFHLTLVITMFLNNFVL